MHTLRLNIIFRIICFAIAVSSLLNSAMYIEKVTNNPIIELTNNSVESCDDVLSKHELPSAHVYLFNTIGMVELVCNYTNHYILQYKPEITPPPPKVA